VAATWPADRLVWGFKTKSDDMVASGNRQVKSDVYGLVSIVRDTVLSIIEKLMQSIKQPTAITSKTNVLSSPAGNFEAA